MSWKEGRRLISLMLQTKPRVCDWKCPASCRMVGPKRRRSQEYQVHCEHHLLPWFPASLASLAPMAPSKPCFFRPWQVHKNYEPEKKKKNLSISESFVLWLFSLWAEQIPEGSSCVWPLLRCVFPKAFSLIKRQSAQEGRKWPWINPFFGCFIYCTFVPLFCLCGQYLSSFHKESGIAYKNVSIKITPPCVIGRSRSKRL